MPKPPQSSPLANSLTQLAADLIADYRDLRAGKLSVREARTRATVAREAMRAVHLNFEGLKFLSDRAKAIGSGEGSAS
jgi:hypothetical protein